MENRFQRLKLLIGEKNFAKLNESTVAVFGVGGVGSFTVEALARSGIGHLILIDKDNIDETNINRQLHALTSTVGKSKVEVMRERILDINPAAQVEAIQKFLLPSEPVENFFICQYDYGIKIISSMGAGNKLDPTRFKVADIFQTTVDPVAKVLRKRLKDKEIKRLKVVYSDEVPRPVKDFIGSTAFVPSVAGLIIAGEVVKDLIIL